MNKNIFFSKSTKAFLYGGLFVLFFFAGALAQNRNGSAKPLTPKITQIDEIALKKLLAPSGKPLLINFWATWCDPCREEFPDLVKIDAEYKGRINFITISLDDLAEINRDVPKFLGGMKAEMPAYLLKTADENAAIASVAKDWTGGLPFTVLFSPKGEIAYFRQGKIVPETLRGELNKNFSSDAKTGDELYLTIDFVKVKDGIREETMFFYEKNWKPYREEALKRGIIHSYELLESVPETTAPFDLILITRYKSKDQHQNSEKNFEPILKELRPNGPELKNTIKPDEFRQSVFVYRGKALMTSIP
ncbi:MAG: TlpA family protein disulfide reductase [Saprospiraceae bacterium]|nr:TlpA family protein disulfide reductase [Pyrinomonadaceae bacterium]